ncbi:5'-3' exoribonuclease 1-like [Oppia nitens]|uniref:5'-3' exoribonuclease 1-like n=1 Tax=Oppia nitens TaxID=1686743 RepID=UPI0023DB298F|nr:5'-3' exoribonuclease 1-like [Oppia nitens]XP_054164927.1 5'-3' exoribonuclease 1-like [Oppia nitens]
MGVPKFYRWISERYPCLSEVVREYQIPEFDNLYLDMNGIIHNCSHPNDEDVHFRISEEKIFQDIFRYIEFLFRMIKPRKVFFMAIDGVAPRAKMNQQRGRRFRSAQEAETRENEAKERGEKLPEEKRFDSNCITPGTPFMDRLHQHLKYFVVNKISSDDLWRNVKVILSGHETPGEGEHKVMDFIRYEKSQPGYDPNTRHCLYGLDADLIMLGVCSHEPHFSLLREEVKYNRSKTDKNKRDSNPEAITFHLFHLSLFREYLDHEFSELKNRLPFGYELEKIIDDWVLMGFLVGNDFIPHIPHFHINKSSLLKLYAAYKLVMPTLDGYLNDNGTLNLQRFQKYINELKNVDIDNFNDTWADLKYFESKTGRKLFNRNEEPNTSRAAAVSNLLIDPDIENESEVVDIESDEIYESSDSELFKDEFRSHKDNYYIDKLKYQQVDQSVLREQAHEYIRAIQWNLHYYYNGCMSWSWYYPHHYAPYISDVNEFHDINLGFDMGRPFKPFEQLLAVLPAASKELLPKAYESLVTSPNSPLIDFYPEEFETDQNEKQQSWEAVVLIPFIDEKLLLDATKSVDKKLTADEARRNRHGPHLIFTYCEQSLPPYVSPNRSIFPDIVVNHSQYVECDINSFLLPAKNIHKGLCRGVKLNVFIPGFPTFKYIQHEIAIRKERVRVFEQTSMGDNMIVIIKNNTIYEIESVAQQLLDQTVFVNWPHLLEAKVFKVTNSEIKFVKDGNRIICNDLTDQEFTENNGRINSVIRKCKERWGIIVSKPDVLVHVYPMTGWKYMHGVKGKLTLEKQWGTTPIICPIQMVVKDITIHENHSQQFRSIEDMFPRGCECFPIANPFYGSKAKVIDCKNGVVTVEVFPQLEPDLREIQDRAQEIIHEKYMPNYVLAQKLGINAHLLSRITGTIFVLKNNRDSQKRINIGLNLKFNSKNEEIPGYSIKRDDNWLFSGKIFSIMEEYLTKFPFIFEKLSVCVEKDFFNIEDLIPGEDKLKTLETITNWLKSLPSSQEKRQKCNAEILDEFVVEAIEDVINTHIVFPQELAPVMETYKPIQLFRPIHYLGYSLPDPKATYNLFDRVVNIRSGISVPLGAKGTIVGKHIDDSNEVNTLFDIVFDEEFVGGVALRCTKGKGYKLSPANLINITYGLKMSGKYENFVSSGQPLQTRPQHRHHKQRDQNYGNSSQYPNSFGHRNPRNKIANTHQFGSNFANPPNYPNPHIKEISVNLNHSSNSPFQSPKHESQRNQEFPPMQDLWNQLSGIKTNDDKLLPKPSFAEITANSRDNVVNNSIPNTKNKNRRYGEQQMSTNTLNNIQLIDSFRHIFDSECQKYFKQLAIFEILTFGQMRTQSLTMTLPDKQCFNANLSAYDTPEDASEHLSRKGLEYINNKFGANIDLSRPKKMLATPSFIAPNYMPQSRPRIAESSLPRPPSNWFKSNNKRDNRPANRKNQNQSQPTIHDIPESFVEHNERILRQRQSQSAKANVSYSANKERNFQPKKLFDPRNDNSMNLNSMNLNSMTNTKPTQMKIMKRGQNDGPNEISHQRKTPQTSNTVNSSPFGNQFVPLQVARNNQLHRQLTPQKPNESKTIDITSSSDDIEILTPDSLVHMSASSPADKINSDEIEILTPEALTARSSANIPSKSGHNRRSRIRVNLS